MKRTIDEELLSDICNLHDKFINAQQSHPMDIPEWTGAIHDLQKIIALRLIRVERPDLFPVKDEKSLIKTDAEKALCAKLKIIKQLQDENPGSHVCGSIGLLLHGIDLKRDWVRCDIDMISPKKFERTDGAFFKSEGNDFDQALILSHKDDTEFFSNIEIKLNDASKYVTREYQGVEYNVSELDEIFLWKERYAIKGYKKHRDDLHKINPDKWKWEDLDIEIPF